MERRRCSLWDFTRETGCLRVVAVVVVVEEKWEMENGISEDGFGERRVVVVVVVAVVVVVYG